MLKNGNGQPQSGNYRIVPILPKAHLLAAPAYTPSLGPFL